MSGFNINKINHSSVVTVINAVSADYDTVANLTTVKTSGFSKLLVLFTCSTGWDRAGNIKLYGSIDNVNYILADTSVTNGSFSVTTTDTGKYYTISSIPPFVRVGFEITTAGTTGTITVKVMPLN